MIVVMQCAKTKRAEAGYMRTMDGQPVEFVAQPEFAPARAGFVCARPDDIADTDRTWREELVIYNRQHNPDVADIPLRQHLHGNSDDSNVDLSRTTDPLKLVDGSPTSATNLSSSPIANPLGLLPAWQLYKNKTYQLLADTFGPKNLYIFSAGWGLVRSDFMIPNYDITLSPNATGPDKYKRRRKDDPYNDFAMLPIAPTNTAQSNSSGGNAPKSPAPTIDPPKSDSNPAGPIVFLGSKAYVPLFLELTDSCSTHRIIFHNSKTPPEAPNCEIYKHDIAKKTDWHYDAAKALANNPNFFRQS